MVNKITVSGILERINLLTLSGNLFDDIDKNVIISKHYSDIDENIVHGQSLLSMGGHFTYQAVAAFSQRNEDMHYNTQNQTNSPSRKT